MAEVFLGSTMGAEGFSRRVAIKRVLPGYSDNDAFARMFIDEAQLSSRLVHPNIVSVLDFDRDAEHRLFLVMELVEGKDLDALVGTGILPIPVTIYVIGEVLRGLGYAHDLPVGNDVKGLVHRDVSPHNVLLGWEGTVKVSDFGIAKARAASEATASVFIKGKPAYMSPEQANGQALDGRSDLFAVGIMLWEMLVGRRLFIGGDTRSTLAAVLFGQVPRPRSLRGDIPKDLERVVMKLLERDLPARYATAEDAIADLLDCADAPKAGREALAMVLTERFAAEAPVRQSRAGARAASMQNLSSRALPTPPPGGMVSARPTLPDGSAGAAVPSIGAMMNAPTGTMDPIEILPPGQRRRMSKFLLVALVTAGSAAATFGLVSVLKGSSSGAGAPSGSDVAPGSAATGGVASGTDAAPLVATAVPDAAVPEVAPVGLVALDASVAMAVPDAIPDATKDAAKDASPKRVAHAAVEKKFGQLSVAAWPTLTVYVDNKKYGDTPKTIKLTTGKHALRLRNDETGYDEKLSVQITENQTMTIDRTK